MKYGETIKNWTITLDGKENTFRMEHQFWTGERKYFINDKLIKHDRGGLLQSASFGKDVPFQVGEHSGEFRYRAIGRLAFYDLVIDGSTIEGREERTMRLPPWAIVLLIILILMLVMFFQIV